MSAAAELLQAVTTAMAAAKKEERRVGMGAPWPIARGVATSPLSREHEQEAAVAKA